MKSRVAARREGTCVKGILQYKKRYLLTPSMLKVMHEFIIILSRPFLTNFLAPLGGSNKPYSDKCQSQSRKTIGTASFFLQEPIFR